jgi:proteic killer suppression protein
VIASFKSRSLKRFWERGEVRRLPAQFVNKIALVLDALDAAALPSDLDLPGFGFHSLAGDRRGEFAVTVSRNWRITFRWQDGDAVAVDFEDYHGR